MVSKYKSMRKSSSRLGEQKFQKEKVKAKEEFITKNTYSRKNEIHKGKRYEASGGYLLTRRIYMK